MRISMTCRLRSADKNGEWGTLELDAEDVNLDDNEIAATYGCTTIIIDADDLIRAANALRPKERIL